MVFCIGSVREPASAKPLGSEVKSCPTLLASVSFLTEGEFSLRKLGTYAKRNLINLLR
jgi:hypothetical protein